MLSINEESSALVHIMTINSKKLWLFVKIAVEKSSTNNLSY